MKCRRKRPVCPRIFPPPDFPICSIAASLEDIVKREARPSDGEEDLRRGLRVIAERSDALSRFMKDYGRLTRLPKPQLRPVAISSLVRAAVGLERRMAVEVIPGGGPGLAPFETWGF